MAIFNPPNVTLTAQTLTPAQASIAEGSSALVKYDFSGALAAPVTLNFALQGWGGTVAGVAGPVAGAAAPDYGTVVTLTQYTGAGQTGIASTSTVNTALFNAITLSTGTRSFTLSTNFWADAVLDPGKGVNFILSQTAPIVGLNNFGALSSTVSIVDGTVAPVTPATQFQIAAPQATPMVVYEGNNAIATFLIVDTPTTTPASGLTLGSTTGGGVNVALQVATSVTLSLSAAGGTTMADLGAITAEYYGPLGLGGGWQPLIYNAAGVATLVAGTSGVRLTAAIAQDTITEYGESITFGVSSNALSTNLINSSYVAQQINLTDNLPTPLNATIALDTLIGTTGSVDQFVFAAGTGVVVAGPAIDIISNFGPGDTIKLPSAAYGGITTIDVTLDPTYGALNGGGAPAAQTALINLWISANGGAFPTNGAGNVLKIIDGVSSYLLMDANGNGIIDSTSDMFIKIVGTTAADSNFTLVQLA